VSLLGEAWDILRKYGDVIGIEWDGVPGPLDKQPNSDVLGSIANLAGSPILSAAQLTIDGMKATTGSGEPEMGAAFETSAKKYEEAGELLIETEVEDPAQWDGTAAVAYQAKDREHRHQTLEVAEAERRLRTLLRDLGGQVKDTRQTHPRGGVRREQRGRVGARDRAGRSRGKALAHVPRPIRTPDRGFGQLQQRRLARGA
jgi:EspA/EspE family